MRLSELDLVGDVSSSVLINLPQESCLSLSATRNELSVVGGMRAFFLWGLVLLCPGRLSTPIIHAS
jgi:hypothetical protein